ncbi:hypothetical protein HZH68_016052 [Vespula germanica]|uniref:Uncharacterized protein n=1 Tax=Vespula germanica TaxID=30212 RepID=A0A834J5X8_VESGE|nr:hypothetical protein HZH68_016052 [Vespula germanica]
MLMSTDISVRVDASAVFCDNGYVGVRVVEIPIDRKVSEKLIYKLTDPIEDRLREVNNISATFLYPSEFHVESLTTCAGVDGDGGGSDGNDGDGGDGGGGGGIRYERGLCLDLVDVLE